jgi:phosphoribosylamine--glycine ligase
LRILIISVYAEYELDWALRCAAGGHQVKMFSRQADKRGPDVGSGMIERVEDFNPWMRWADIVFCSDNTKYIARIEQWRREGVLVIGPTQQTANWELDRMLGMKVFKDHGFDLPDYREFSDYDKALAYVNKEQRAFVSKPCGDEPDKTLTYVAPSARGLMYMLERWKRQQKLKGKFILQEKVSGVEMAVTGFFGPAGWARGWTENWEHKKLFPKDLGPGTGEMGTVIRVVKRSKLAEKTLVPLTDLLHQEGYCGAIDVNCLIGEAGEVWPLEFTMRPGVPLFQIQQALIDGDHAEWLRDLAEGRECNPPWIYDTFAVGIVMVIGDFPHSHATNKEVVGVPIYGVNRFNRDSIHPSMVMMGEVWQDIDGKLVKTPGWVTAGDYVLTATGIAETVQDARNKALRALDPLKETPASPFWRHDIGNRLAKEFPLLQERGYAAGARFSDA